MLEFLSYGLHTEKRQAKVHVKLISLKKEEYHCAVIQKDTINGKLSDWFDMNLLNLSFDILLQ